MARVPILYDADCGFCKWTLAVVLAWDRRRRLRPVALQAPEADELLAGMERERRFASWHLVEPGGRVRSAGAAVAPLMRLLPGGGPFGALARSFPAVTNRAYRWVADHRSSFGKLTRPLVPRAERRIERRARR